MLRPQISLRRLLFVVAIVALNCGAFRPLYAMVAAVHGGYPLSTLWMTYGVDDGYPPSIRSCGFAVGIIPLLNVALIGAILYVAGRLRSRRSGLGGTTRFSPAGFTFFSLHFLALGCVVCLFMPGVIAIYAQIMESALEPASEACAAFFARFGDTLPWFIVECTILFVFISGPLLLLSWIGRLLARWCAATLPGRRLRVMTGLVSFGFTSVALAIALMPLEFADERSIELGFQVVDKDSGQPIGGAFLRISDPFDPEWTTPIALTAPDGRARLTGRFRVFGERNAFQSTGAFAPWGRWLELSLVHYQTVRIPLPEVLGPHLELGCRRIHQVDLAKGTTPEGSFRDIAGIYIIPSHGFGGSEFCIEPDGRFAWSMSTDYSPAFQEYGFLKRNGLEIELVPTPHPGVPANFPMAATFRVIEWGDRRYLCEMDDGGIRDFCRAALTLERRADPKDGFGGYICISRASDFAKPLTGLPRLPLKVWAKFLLGELSLQNEEGSLRLALESLMARDPADGSEGGLDLADDNPEQ